MLDQYGPILIFFAIAAIMPPALLWIAKFFRPTFNPTPEKVMPYECGITPESDARGRYTVRFYVVAILFVVFDVETVFLYPGLSNSRFWGCMDWWRCWCSWAS